MRLIKEGKSKLDLISDKMMTVAQYAKSSGTSPQNIYQRIERNKKNGTPEIVGHVFKEGKLTYLDEVAIAYFDENRGHASTVVDSKELQDKVSALELEVEELKADRDSQRDEKEVYMKRLLEIQQKGIDSSKYIAIEDHKKLETELQKEKADNKETKLINEKQKEVIRDKVDLIKKQEEELKKKENENGILSDENERQGQEIRSLKDSKQELEDQLNSKQEDLDKLLEENERMKNASLLKRIFGKW